VCVCVCVCVCSIRAKYSMDLEGTVVMDCLLTCCCNGLLMCQHARELEHRRHHQQHSAAPQYDGAQPPPVHLKYQESQPPQQPHYDAAAPATYSELGVSYVMREEEDMPLKSGSNDSAFLNGSDA
jgi:hypothetical protein